MLHLKNKVVKICRSEKTQINSIMKSTKKVRKQGWIKFNFG